MVDETDQIEFNKSNEKCKDLIFTGNIVLKTSRKVK